MVLTLKPVVSTSTAHARIAPAATNMRPTPMPIQIPPRSRSRSGCSAEQADQREDAGDDQQEEQELCDRDATDDCEQQQQGNKHPEKNHSDLLVFVRMTAGLMFPAAPAT